jgi:O-antigen/teichoic acid export membrane protein
LIAMVWKGSQQGWIPNFSRFHIREVISILRQSVPLAAFSSFQILYYRVDSIILKSLSGNDAVGYYDLAAKVVFVVLAFSQVFVNAIFPVFSSVRDDSQAFGQKAGRSIKFLFLLGLPATVGGILLAQPIIFLISGSKYFPSVAMFAVLMLSVGPFFLSHVYVIALAIYNVTRLNLQFVILFTLNAGLNFILIPRMGGVGASWATVSCEAFGLILGFWLAAPYLKKLQWVSLARPFLACIAASAVMGAGIWWDPRLYWIVVGPVVYGAGIWLFRGLEPEDWKNIQSILGKKMA